MSLSSRVLLRSVKNYRVKKLNKLMTDIRSLIEELNQICKERFDDDLFISRKKIIEQSYDNLTKKIIKRDVIDKIKIFIDQYKKIYQPLNPLNEKIFLSLWVFSAFPDIVLDPKFFNSEELSNISKIKEDLFNISVYLVDMINNWSQDNNFLVNFNKHINKYTIFFDTFIKEDKKIKIVESIESYVVIKKNINKISVSLKYNDQEKQEIIEMMHKNLIKVKKFIANQIKNFNFGNLDLIVDEIILIENTMIVNYVNTIEKKLNDGHYIAVLEILEDIQEFIRNMTKIDNEPELEEIIDPKYIIQLIKNNLLSKDEIINFGLNLSTHITNLGSIKLAELRHKEIEKFRQQNININALLANVIYINLESTYLVLDEILSFQSLVNEVEIFDT
jgi:hypothetical protein